MTEDKYYELIEMARRKEYKVCIWGCGYIGKYPGRKMLSEFGIEPDYYCDNNPKEWEEEIIEGIKCVNPDEILRDNPIVFPMVTETFENEICTQLQEMGIFKIVTYTDICKMKYKDFFPFMNRKQIAVYTCVVNDYDEVEEPLSISPECDYYIISDKKPEKESVFQYIDINDCVPESITDATRQNRYCKINAHKIFPQYRYSIYADGSIRTKKNIVEKINDLPVTRIITRSRKNWDNVYYEIFRRIVTERDNIELFMKQAEAYWLQGMPESFASLECAVLIREHNHPLCKKLMEDWWEQIEQFSRRDQVSLPYVLWKNGYKIEDVGTVNGDEMFNEKYMIGKKNHAKPRNV